VDVKASVGCFSDLPLLQHLASGRVTHSSQLVDEPVTLRTESNCRVNLDCDFIQLNHVRLIFVGIHYFFGIHYIYFFHLFIH